MIFYQTGGVAAFVTLKCRRHMAIVASVDIKRNVAAALNFKMAKGRRGNIPVEAVRNHSHRHFVFHTTYNTARVASRIRERANQEKYSVTAGVLKPRISLNRSDQAPVRFCRLRDYPSL